MKTIMGWCNAFRVIAAYFTDIHCVLCLTRPTDKPKIQKKNVNRKPTRQFSHLANILCRNVVRSYRVKTQNDDNSASGPEAPAT